MASVVLFLKALAEGERWITLRPGGPGTEGHPVLIKPSGGGAYHIIGGAGGSLNYLRLRGVRSEDSYRQEAKQRAQSKREEAKRQEARDKEAGLTKTRSQALEGARAQLGDARVKLVQKVATALGWKDEDLRFPVEQYGNVTEGARKAAEKKHATAIMRKVDEAINYQRKVLVLDAEARHEAGLGEVPLSTAKPDALSVQDLDPIEPASKGLGFAPEYSKRAGITREEATAEAKAIRPPVEPAKAEAAEKRKEIGARIAEELETVRQPAPPLNPTAKVETQKVVEIMKAAKEYRMIASGTRKQVQQIKSAKTKEEMEPKGAVVVEIDSKPTDADVLKDVASDLKTLRTRAFLDQIGTTVAGDNIGRHVAAGAFNAVNSLSLAVAGMGLVDRSVVDVLGVTGAAHALVNRLRRDLSAHELEQLSEAMAAYHQDHYMAASSDALREAVDLHEQAKEIELGAAENTDDLAAMQELNAKRRDMVGQAKRALGTALGEMETNAAIVLALQQGTKAEVPLSMGKTTLEQAIVQLRAIGLNQGDYELDQVSGSALVTIKQSGLDKLAAPIDRADLERVRDSTAITAGLQDEDDYLPGGFADRPDLAMQAKPGVAPRLAKPMDTRADPTKAIADYVGGRAADGDTPAEIMAGLLSEDTVSRFADRGAYMTAIEALAPLNGPDGKQVRVETYARKFDKLADDYVERTYGADRTPLQKQSFVIDKPSIDALHRTLADNPDGVAAFKPVGELTPQDEGALRKVFAAEFGRIDPETEALRAKLTKLETQEPEKESDGLFGAGVNPDWTAWRQERDQAAEAVNAAAMDWGKYVKTHGTPQAAYAAMQDVVRSKVLQGFAQTYNTLHPKKPLAIGKQAIANDLAHLDALDPAGRQKRLQDRQQRLASMRNRVQGQFAAGSVLEKEAAAREAEQGSLQAQMGLFGTTDEAPKQTPAKLGERYSLGHVAEQQIAKMMPSVGANFKPGQKQPIFQPTMSGAYVGRQRAIKLIERNKRLELGLGVGSGKTSVALGAFTDLKTAGKVKRGLFAVPSVVVGEFHGQALSMLEPGKFKWMANPGASREERIAAYKGQGGEDFSVVTHQAIREDFDSLLAAEGMAPSKFDALPPTEQRATAKRLLGQAGWDMQYLAVDEGHNLLNRQGKKNSHLANVMDAISGGTDYYVSATADPVKNDMCLHPDVQIYDPVREVSLSVKAWAQAGIGPFVWSLAGNRVVIKRAGVPFVKGRSRPMFKVVTASGRTVVVASSHQFLTRHGWQPLSAIDVGEPIAVSGHQTSFASLPQCGDEAACVRSCYCAPPDCRGGCLPYVHPHDEQPPSEEGSGRSSVQQLAYVLEYTAACQPQDDPEGPAPGHSRPGSRGDRLSISGAHRPDASLDAIHAFACGGFPCGCSSCEPSHSLRRGVGPYSPVSCRRTPTVQSPLGVRPEVAVSAPDAVLGHAADRSAFPFGVLFDRIATVIREPAADIYDLTVPDTHNYWAQGIWHHNSEAFDVLRKLDPERYQDRAAFMRRYGPDTEVAKEGLKREFIGRLYTGQIDPGVQVKRQTVSVPVTPDAGQHEHLDALEAAYGAAKLARARGEVDVPAMKQLAPYAFQGVPAAREAEVAERLSSAMGVVHETAVNRAINDGAKTTRAVEIANERRGKPGVVFCHYLDRVGDLAKRLKAEGHRVGTLTGKDTTKAKDAIKRQFQNGDIDILVASDAGSVGANLQRGQWLLQYDLPMTAMTHAQRNGRIHRIGQKNNVELIDLVADHPAERRAQARLRDKYELRSIMVSPMDGLDDSGIGGYLNRVKAGKAASEDKTYEKTAFDVEPEPPAQTELAA